MRQRLFAWFYARNEGALRRATAPVRSALVGDLIGDVLEIGCGTGANFEHYGVAARVRATDPSRHMLPYARREASRAGASISVKLADAARLPHADASFDAAVATLVLCSVSDVAAVLAEIRRVLKPDGSLRLFEHVRSTRPWVARLQGLASPPWGFVADGCHLDRDTATAVHASGFRTESESVVTVRGLPMRTLAIRARR